jgi:hypothetical protein
VVALSTHKTGSHSLLAVHNPHVLLLSATLRTRVHAAFGQTFEIHRLFSAVDRITGSQLLVELPRGSSRAGATVLCSLPNIATDVVTSYVSCRGGKLHAL